jgi:hypothetical protein
VTTFCFEFVTWGAVFGETTFDGDYVAIQIGSVRVCASVEDFNNDGCGTRLKRVWEVRFSLFDEVFQTWSAVCGLGFSAETNCQGSQNRRLTRTIVANDKIDFIAKVDFKTFMTLH